MKFIKLSEIFDVHAGGTPSRAKMTEYYGGKIPWVKISDMLQEKISFTEEYITDKAVKDKNLKILPAGTLLISIFATVGRTAILKIDAATNQAIVGLISKNEYFNNLYVKYFVDHKINDIKKLSRGVAQNNINKSILSSIEIPIKTINEQIQIVNKLVIADELRQKRKKAIELLDEYLRSVFYEMFGDVSKNEKKWDSFKAKEIFEIQLGKMLSAKNYKGTHLKPYLRNINVRWNRIDISDVNEMDYDEREFQKYLLKKGDILVCEGGEVGRTAIYNGEIDNCCFQNALHRLRVIKPIINSKYFLYFMWNAADKGLILKKTSTVTIAHFTAEKFKEFGVLTPPIELQNKFAQIVEQVEKTKAKMQESLKEMDNLFNSLMQQAFKG